MSADPTNDTSALTRQDVSGRLDYHEGLPFSSSSRPLLQHPQTPPHSPQAQQNIVGNANANVYFLCPNERCKHENWYHQEGTETCCAYTSVSVTLPDNFSRDVQKNVEHDDDRDEEMTDGTDSDDSSDREEGESAADNKMYHENKHGEVMICCQCGAHMEPIFLSDSEEESCDHEHNQQCHHEHDHSHDHQHNHSDENGYSDESDSNDDDDIEWSGSPEFVY